MAQSSDRSKISVQSQFPRPLTSASLRAQLSALSISSLEEKMGAFAHTARGGRNSQPSSPSQILKQALRTGINSPKCSDFSDQENRPPTAFVFSTPTKPAKASGKYIPSTLSQISSTAAISQNPMPRQSFTRGSSEQSLPKRELSSIVTQTRSRVSHRSSGQLYREHLFNTFQALKFVKRVRDADPLQLAAKSIHLPREKYGRKTVIFDLDETLVHCTDNVEKAHIAVPVVLPNGDTVIAGVNIRPYAKECLATVSAFCEVVIFTASQKCYADQVLDYLDPTRSVISLRLYRESCIVTDGVFIKDLRILGNRRPQDLIIVDNAAYSFAYQLSNGVPIISWYDDPSDRELYNLVDYLRGLSLLEDVRPANRDTFHLETFCEDYEKDCLKERNIGN